MAKPDNKSPKAPANPEAPTPEVPAPAPETPKIKAKPNEEHSDESHRSFERRDATRNFVVVALLLVINACQFCWGTWESLGKNAAEEKLNTANLKLIEQNQESQKYQIQALRYANSIDIHQRYMIMGGWDMVRFMGFYRDKTPTGTFTNSVYKQIAQWLPSRGDEIGNFKTYDVPKSKEASSLTHAMIVFHVVNRSKITASRVTIILCRNEFSKKGEMGEDVWNLDKASWKKEPFTIGDLKPGQEKYVPLMHIIGTRRYMGTGLMPETIEWDNPVTLKHEKKVASEMLPSDTWQIEGLVFISQ